MWRYLERRYKECYPDGIPETLKGDEFWADFQARKKIKDAEHKAFLEHLFKEMKEAR
jgi:hypothetical protein